MKKADVVVIGAGPAGLSAAITLAKGGANVIVYERNDNIGKRFNGDFQGIENWSSEIDTLNELSGYGIQLESCSVPCNTVTIFDPNFKKGKIKSPNPIFYMVKRGESENTLDMHLQDLALEAGVKIRFSETVRKDDANIIASGPRGVDSIAAGITFPTNLNDGFNLLLNDKYAPKGYAYFLVFDGRATLATVLYDKFFKVQECLDFCVERFSQLMGFESPRNPKRWGGFGKFGVPKTAIISDNLYVGEAIGFQDYLAGFGMRYAMISGCLAARSILNNENYDRLWKSRILTLMKASLSNRLLYSTFGNFGYSILFRLAMRSRDGREFMNWLYDWGLSRKLLYPFAKLRFKM